MQWGFGGEAPETASPKRRTSSVVLARQRPEFSPLSPFGGKGALGEVPDKLKFYNFFFISIFHGYMQEFPLLTYKRLLLSPLHSLLQCIHYKNLRNKIPLRLLPPPRAEHSA